VKLKRAEFLLVAIACHLQGYIVVAGAADFPDYYYPNPGISTNGIVRAVFFFDGKLYVGGNFTRVTDKNGTYNRTDCAAYDTATGLVTSFKANTNTGTVRAIAAGNGKLFVGGSFTQINQVSCSKVAALDPASGAVATGFRKNAGTIDGTVWALAVSDSALYIGGSFTSVGGYSRYNMASLNAASGALDQSFDPSPSDPLVDSTSSGTPGGVYSLAIHPKNPKIIFVGGNFQSIAGLTDRKFLAALNSDGTPGPVFQGMDQYPVIDLDAYGSFCYVGAGGYSNRVLSFGIDSDPYIRQWRSVWVNGDVQAVAYARQGYVFFGCHDGIFDSTDDSRLGVLDAKTGKIYDAYPPMNSFFGVRAIDAVDNCLAVGGEFTKMNGISQKYLAVFTKFPFSFDSVYAPAIPGLAYPSDSMNGIAVAPVLSWNFAAHAATYELQVARDPQFSNLAVTRNGLTAYRLRCTGLDNSTEYWWRVRARNAAGVSDWSAIWLFITLPGRRDIPVLSYPADGAIHQPTAFDLAWHQSGSARSYRLQLSESSDFTTSVIDREGIIDTTFALSGLANTTAYFWRVKAMTAGGESDWSAIWKFITLPGRNDIPALSYPVDGATDQPVAFDFCWHPNGSALSYGIQLSQASDDTTLLIDQSGIVDTSFGIAGLANNTAYYWRVNARTAGGITDWASAGFRTIVGAAPAPRGIAPADNALQIILQPAFRWASAEGAACYRVQVSMDSIFAATTFDTSGLTDTSIVVTGLAEDTRYFWRINGSNVGGGAWSQPMRFTTVYPLPLTPLPITPAAGSIATTDSLRLIWNRSAPHVTKYWIEIAHDTLMREAFIDSMIVDTEFIRYHLDNKKEFWWRVRAHNETGWGAFSKMSYFKTAFPPLWVKRFSLDKITLSGRYGSITYGLAKQCDVRMELFDLSGKSVWKIVWENRSPGLYTENLSSRPLPVGSYLLYFKAGHFTKTGNAILVR
jgi:hypothetical protein